MDIDSYAELCKANRVLQADLSAAQDEIERLLSEIAALRIERDNLQDSLDAWAQSMGSVPHDRPPGVAIPDRNRRRDRRLT